jgi:PAS domain S-box-containing protein
VATILIVDDLPADRAILVTLLRDEGHRTLEAADGSEGLAVARAEHPDVVITDMLMPVMDGYELVRLLRIDPDTSTIPIVFYTATYGVREARALAVSSSVSYLLTKPAERQDVLAVVNRVLSGAPVAEPPSDAAEPATNLDREELRLLTDTLSEKAVDLRAANARLRALINIGLELASERDTDRLLRHVCAAVRDLFGATYVTLGIVDLDSRTVQRVETCGVDPTAWIKAGDPVSGILGTVVHERRTVRGANPGGSPAGLQLPPLHPEIQAFVAAPVASPAQVYGWLCLVANQGRTFSEDDEQLVAAVSGQVGRIYENGYFHLVANRRAAQLEHEILERVRAEEEARRRAQLSALGAAIGLSLIDSDTLAHALQRCAEAIVTHLGVAFVRVWTLNEGEGMLEMQASAGLYTHLDGPHGRVPLGRLKIGRIAQDRQAHLTNAVIGDPDILDQDWARREGMVAFAGHPLIVGDRAVGVMALFARQALTDQVIAALASVADHIALGIERHRSADALRTAEERMRFALEAAGVGIWDMDYPAGVLRWSPTIEAQYGLAQGTFGGTFEAFVACIHPDDREAVLETFGKAMTAGADFSFQSRAIWPDGSVRWLNNAGRIRLGDHGEPVRGIGISLDITARRTLELQYQQAQKMEAIGRLAGGVAHDFNNLLTVILGYCDLLQAGLGEADPRRLDVGEIQKAGESAAGLTRQLLAFSRKQIIEPTLLDLNVVVADMRAMLERLIGEDVSVVLGLHAAPSTVRADRGQVEQVILNLAVNARDAMTGGGRLSIDTDSVDFDAEYAATHLAVAPGPHVVLTVTDTGTGMTPQVQARLFEPFFTTKEPGKGTGLGLATVHGVVTQAGGSISVFSEVGRGASFKLHFPAAEAGAIVPDAPSTVVRRDGAGKTVLVVEDAEALRELTRRLLEQQGYEVLAAANADGALVLFEKHPAIDVLLTDVVMPGVSGPELTRQLVQRRPGLKVVYMSGYTADAIVHRGALVSGTAFLQKPFAAESLERTIQEALRR